MGSLSAPYSLLYLPLAYVRGLHGPTRRGKSFLSFLLVPMYVVDANSFRSRWTSSQYVTVDLDLYWCTRSCSFNVLHRSAALFQQIVRHSLWLCLAHFFENKVHEQHPSVKALMVLPGIPWHRDGDPAAQVFENIENKETELMAFFSYNAAGRSISSKTFLGFSMSH